MIAKGLSKTIVTAPMVFLVIGFTFSFSPEFAANKHNAEQLLHLMAEIALIVLLFLDAAKIDLPQLIKQRGWPFRMLLIGLPLCILIGSLIAIPFFPDYSLAMVVLIASILAPTDAALSQAVVSNKDVPNRERQSLIAESGLNDGLALPVILFVVCFLSSSSGDTQWGIFAAKQLILGPFVGALLGYMAAKVFLFSEARALTEDVFEGIAVLALAGSTFLIANLVGGNGFIAAFVAGLSFGNFVKGHCRFIYEFTESEGQMLVWGSFTLIGLSLLPDALEHINWQIISYLLLSLFLIRPIAIYLALLGSDARFDTRIFFGWFGPRGLATALFALMAAKQLESELAEAIIVIAINAVWISTLLHGVSANLGARIYAKRKG